MENKRNPVPLIDRALFFDNPEIIYGKISPDGKYISFLKEYEGILNIWIKERDSSFEKAHPLTRDKRPMYTYFWTKDSRYILYLNDKNGDENFNLFSIDIKDFEKGIYSEPKNLLPYDNVKTLLYHICHIDNDTIMIGLNNRDNKFHDLYKLKISTGELELIYENTNRIDAYYFDWNDNLRLLSNIDEKGYKTFFFIKGKELIPVYSVSLDETAYIYGWNSDNSKCFLETNRENTDLTCLYLMCPETGEIEKLEGDPDNKVDFAGLWLNENTRELIRTFYIEDRMKSRWYDKELEGIYNHLIEIFPEREIYFVSNTLDYSIFLINISGDNFISETYLYDKNSKEIKYQYTDRPELKKFQNYLSKMKPISYKSSDGLEIPGYLTIPEGFGNSNLPLIILPHGGPKGSRDYWGFHPLVQFLANRGYAVLQPNFRASGGYGKFFQNAGDMEWGRLMQDDITWGVKHLIQKGIADPDRIGIMGISYGGYAALAGLAFTPDLYACGISIVGPVNLFTLLDSIPPSWELLKAKFYAMMGDPATKEGQKRLKEASPLFSADKIKKPLLVVQGANDPRVKQAEADQIVSALKNNNKKVKYLLADNEGHGFQNPINRMALYYEIEKFLAEVLDQEYQKDLPEKISKRLKEITVDISKMQ